MPDRTEKALHKRENGYPTPVHVCRSTAVCRLYTNRAWSCCVAAGYESGLQVSSRVLKAGNSCTRTFSRGRRPYYRTVHVHALRVLASYSTVSTSALRRPSDNRLRLFILQRPLGSELVPRCAPFPGLHPLLPSSEALSWCPPAEAPYFHGTKASSRLFSWR